MTEEFFAAEEIVPIRFERDHLRHPHQKSFRAQAGPIGLLARIPEITVCTMIVQYFAVPMTRTMIIWCYCEVEKIFFYETRRYEPDPLQNYLDTKKDKERTWTAM